MNQLQFLTILNNELQALNKTEREDILTDFKEHFNIGRIENKTEEEIAASLGSPKQIAKDLLVNYHLEKAAEKTPTETAANTIRPTLMAIGLAFFNLIFVLGPVIAIAGIIFAGWVSGGAFIISPILSLAVLVIHPPGFTIFEFFLSIGLAGLGIFLMIGMYYVTKYAGKLLTIYLKFNINLVKG